MNEPIYDLAIIGGGIAGAGIARDASLRGAHVLLLEKNTFGSGTSSKSSKLIHGGLRYLETAAQAFARGHFQEFWKNLRFVFLALRETHILHRTAPELVREIQLLVPIYKSGGRGRFTVFFGTTLYGIFSRLAGGKHFSKILWGKKEVLETEPQLNPEGLLGGVIVWDHTTDDAALVRAIVNSAICEGADAYEHSKVTHYLFDHQRKVYVLNVTKNGSAETFHARTLVNAGGPWADQVRALGGEKTDSMMVPVSGAHINVKKFCRSSVILEAEDKRIFFVINRESDARIGTTERIQKDPDHVEATQEEVNYLLRAVKEFFPSADLTLEDILSKDAGIRPLARPLGSVSPTQISREHEFIKGANGVVHVIGVKLTDHRRAAEELIDQMTPDLVTWNPSLKRRSLTRETPLEN